MPTSFRSRFAILPALWLACTASAAPFVSISGQTHGENVSWHHETSAVRTTVYLTNHEPYAVICDAEMKTSYEEKLKKPEITIPAGKTAGFDFRHNKSITQLQVFLVCEADKEQKAKVIEHGKLDGSLIEATTGDIVTHKREPTEHKENKVEVEDLGRFD